MLIHFKRFIAGSTIIALRLRRCKKLCTKSRVSAIKKTLSTKNLRRKPLEKTSTLSSKRVRAREGQVTQNPQHLRPSTVDDEEEAAWYMGPKYTIDDRILGRLLDVYIFSITYEIPGLRLATMLAWQRLYAVNAYIPSAENVRNVYERIPFSSGLTNYLAHCHAFEYPVESIDCNVWETLPGEFLTEVIIVALRSVQGKGSDLVRPDHRWCDLHEHKTKGEKAVCQSSAGRLADLDMEYKAAKAVKSKQAAIQEGGLPMIQGNRHAR
ncbi:hypothetical protein EJ02DRAFT_455651 [Clathrospora elynae]|uniref:Uncharacterized protein n=1 Tax=Clathrospora elynae TaxID=706981 RepID=A0A6A5SMD1_9PLEO|nr:hypothetical protein EJ02DRAFT_455651 [Clathrospora elynae]